MHRLRRLRRRLQWRDGQGRLAARPDPHSTDHAMKQGLSSADIRRRALRPRVLIYLAILLAIVTAFGLSLAMRTPLKMDVLRDRGAMGREVDGGVIENVYRLQIMNT